MIDETRTTYVEVDPDVQYLVLRLARRRGQTLQEFYRDLVVGYADGPIPPLQPRVRPPKKGTRFEVPIEVWERADRRRTAEGRSLSAAIAELVAEELQADAREREREHARERELAQ